MGLGFVADAVLGAAFDVSAALDGAWDDAAAHVDAVAPRVPNA